MIYAILMAVLFVAYANGANDNFKGVASLFGSGTTNYNRALAWACATTFAGSLSSVFFAQKLIKTFSGKGLVPASLTQDPQFLLAVALGAAMTVMIATWIGAPVSTTHGLTGALVGGGLAAEGSIRMAALGDKFLKPLLLSPLIAMLLTGLLYLGTKLYRVLCRRIYGRVVTASDFRFPPPRPAFQASFAQGADCGCESTCAAPPGASDGALALVVRKCCGDEFCGIPNRKWVDSLHYLSAGTLSFARGLNDAPKIMAILVASRLAVGPVEPFAELWGCLAAVSVLMLLGGILSARRVGETMSRRITKMDPQEGLAANLVASLMVIFASKWGIPVSTTHVTSGGLFGIGLMNGKADWRVIGSILAAWVVTLPIAAILAAGGYWLGGLFL